MPGGFENQCRSPRPVSGDVTWLKLAQHHASNYFRRIRALNLAGPSHNIDLCTSPEVSDSYRVMSPIEMFDGDDDAKKKISQMMFTVKKGAKPQGIQRTDMDAKDYERALNRLAGEGWQLVTVTKSNYWVFNSDE